MQTSLLYTGLDRFPARTALRQLLPLPGEYSFISFASIMN